MKKFISSVAIMAICVVAFTIPAVAQEDSIQGIVVFKSVAKNSITIRGEKSTRRHTYFLDENSKIMSQGNPISLADIEPGQAVTLNFRRTDSGRMVLMLRVPDPTTDYDIIPVEIEEDYFIAGEITGLRPTKRTVTIRGENSSERLTLHVPEGVRITKRGQSVPLRALAKGDMVEFHYHETDQGFVVRNRPKAAPAVAVDAQPMNELPKTASNRLALLYATMILLLLGGLVRVARSRLW